MSKVIRKIDNFDSNRDHTDSEVIFPSDEFESGIDSEDWEEREYNIEQDMLHDLYSSKESIY